MICYGVKPHSYYLDILGWNNNIKKLTSKGLDSALVTLNRYKMSHSTVIMTVLCFSFYFNRQLSRSKCYLTTANWVVIYQREAARKLLVAINFEVVGRLGYHHKMIKYDWTNYSPLPSGFLIFFLDKSYENITNQLHKLCESSNNSTRVNKEKRNKAKAIQGRKCQEAKVKQGIIEKREQRQQQELMGTKAYNARPKARLIKRKSPPLWWYTCLHPLH